MTDPATLAADTESSRRLLEQAALESDRKAAEHRAHIEKLHDEIRVTEQRIEFCLQQAAIYRRDSQSLAILGLGWGDAITHHAVASAGPRLVSSK